MNLMLFMEYTTGISAWTITFSNILINDINSSSKDGLFVLFADDTNIFVSDKSGKEYLTRHVLFFINLIIT